MTKRKREANDRPGFGTSPIKDGSTFKVGINLDYVVIVGRFSSISIRARFVPGNFPFSDPALDGASITSPIGLPSILFDPFPISQEITDHCRPPDSTRFAF